MNFIAQIMVNVEELKVQIMTNTNILKQENYSSSVLNIHKFNLGFNQIIRLRSDLKYNIIIAIKSGKVLDNCQ